MDDGRVRRALAHAEQRTDDPDDVAGSLAYLLSSCQDVLDVQAVGVMVAGRNGRLQLLAASTHRSAELELHQSQIDEGPCVDAAESGQSVAVVGEGPANERWPQFGPKMVAAGFRAVHSAPLRDGDSTVGAMALFRSDEIAFDAAEDEAAQAYADLVSRIVLGGSGVAPKDVPDRIDAALASRVQIERAKGVVAQTQGVDMAGAYELMREAADRRGESLTATANDLIDSILRDDVNR